MAATVSFQKLFAVGPFRAELIHLTTLTDQDTVVSLLQNPKGAICTEFGNDANSTAQAAISGKTITVHNPTTGGGTGQVVLIVYGF